MEQITFNSTIDLADRVTALESACTAIVAAINALPDTSALKDQLDAFKTEVDALSGRLDSDEKTIAAMGDTLKTLSPDAVSEVGGVIAEIKTVVNAFHKEVYGDANPNIPFPPVATPEPSTN
jgi:hypothetical protein